jgi:hypothetical protein
MNSVLTRQTYVPVVARLCLRNAIPEIEDAARYLDDAVSAHISNQPQLAGELIAQANNPAMRKAIGEWADSLRGPKSPYNQHRPVPGAPPKLNRAECLKPRMPSEEDKLRLIRRDGFHCRFCGIPVLRKEVRNCLISLYPSVIPWGTPFTINHVALYAMDAQYDHLLPNSRGGSSELSNMVITCNPCNYGRGEHSIEEMGLADPRMREPIHSAWEGLERLLIYHERRSVSKETLG